MDMNNDFARVLGSQQSLLHKPTNLLLDDFGAGGASPGSGSAAALMGLLAGKLICTVCKKSKQKPECRDNHAVLVYAEEQITNELIPELERLFQKDANDFEEVVRLRRARDETSDKKEKAKLAREANNLLESATENAMEIVALCSKLIDFGVTAFEAGWHAVRGDSGAAISAAIAGVSSGLFVINLNLKSLKGRNYASNNIRACEKMYQSLQIKQSKAFSCVTSLNNEAVKAIQLELEGT